VAGITDYWSFVAAVIVFLMLPGPGTFAVLTSTGQGKVRGGFAALFGLILGDWILMALAMLGVAALLQAHPLVFRGVQYLGVAYLVWVGVQLLRAKEGVNTTLLPIRAGKFFRQGFFITLINPKSIVFYMAFFPLFIDPATYRGATTFLAMAGTISLLTLAYGGLLVGVGHLVARRLARNPFVARSASRLAGAVLIGFGIKLSTN
jgi:leucine efflux protein